MKTVDEIMALVDESFVSLSACKASKPGIFSATALLYRSAIEAALKEREAPPKAQPMSESDLSDPMERQAGSTLAYRPAKQRFVLG